MSSSENPHAGQGMVVLDIGADIGALVLTAPPTMAGVEIEICPSGARHSRPDEGAGWWNGRWRHHAHAAPTTSEPHEHSHGDSANPAWPHVAVIARPTPDGARHCAIYPGLREGRYDLWVKPDGETAVTVEIAGGQITSASWPA